MNRPLTQSRESGLTLLETLIAMVLLAVGLLAIVPGLVHFSDVTSSNELRSSAVQAARQLNEQTRRLDPSTLPTSGSSTAVPVTIGDYVFDVTQEYCRDSALCLLNARHITTEVRFDGQLVYSTQTVFTKLR